MKKTLLKTSVLVLSGLGLALMAPPCWSQTYAMVQRQQEKAKAATAPQQLRDVLKTLKNRYGVDILFEGGSVERITVAPEQLDFSEKLEKNLDRVLQATGLEYKKVKNGTYLIVESQPAKKISSIDTQPLSNRPADDFARQEAEKSHSLGNLLRRESPQPVLEQTVKGRITDEAGASLPGVSVVVKGTQRGTTSNADGEFELSVPGSSSVLVFSFVGYQSKEMTVGSQTTLAISLLPSDNALEEVVVVGYGSVRKSDLTGSVAQLKMDGTNELPVTSVEQMLQGRVSGVQITQNTGAPGGGISFLVRGANSVTGSNEPLVVIDGYPVESGSTRPNLGNRDGFSDTPGNNALANLNPNDIESVEILKDASATAIYGSRGANGVVLITTKRGQAGKERIEYNFRYDLSQLPRKIGVLNTEDYMAYSNEAYLNSGRDSVFNYLALANSRGDNFNWQDVIYRTSKTQMHQVSVSGGDERLRYMIAANYLSQEGIITNSGFNRGTVRANLDRQVNKRLKVGLNFNGAMSKTTSVPQSTSNGNISGSVVAGAIFSRPLDKPYTDDEELDLALIGNPATLITLSEDDNRDRTVLLNLYAEYEIADGLKFRLNTGVNDRQTLRQTYSPRGTYYGTQNGGQAYQGVSGAFNYLTEYTLSYNKDITDRHRVNAVGGFTWQEWTARGLGITVRQFPNDNLTYHDLQSGNTIEKPATNTQQWALASWLGRVNYSFDNKYLVTFTGRTDGSTRLAPGSKWSFFPSVAVGWNIHNENFMKGLTQISEFKIRASYGMSGNQSIGVGSTNARLNTVSAVADQSIVVGYTQASMANNSLGWERTAQSNLGADISLFDHRLRLGFDYYKKRTTDLLLNLQIPPSTGFTTYATNVGEIENKGLEFELEGRIFRGLFRWDASGNISFNRNKVIHLGELPRMTGSTFGVNNLSQPLHIALPGYPIGSYFGYRIIGVYQTQEEITAGPSDPARPTPGDYKYADLGGPNGVPDGQITADDRTVIGNPYPDYIFGLTNNFSWKNLTLSVLFQGSVGQDIINLNRHQLDAMNRVSSNNVRQEAWDNRWTGPGTSNTYAKPTTFGYPFQGRFTDFIVEDGSFVRLKNITIGYNIPVQKLKFVRSFRVFATGTNLLTFTNYKGYDPEISGKGGNAMTPGVDYGSIPQMKVYSAGFNVGF
ncbi:TonB-dependent receptor [Rhabdobacter roseus]|uniref:TonB-linked SusC/RagA family outer membrane protein n=1 Tax=Rhabdobacter roseus TaxID=1655419 RepID=A0A840TYM2_9BACT|nr:SusC/RagA family TonB-linked outer membrane protein [Rhabdobacter roseus]MBB5286393.1 TonB-linked SusC/RagA family outer membrane protein [Rhabdobacter roseus]